MTNNDILRRIRYTFNYNEAAMVKLYESAGKKISASLITQWLKKDDDDNYVRCSDREFSTFLNGFINDKRGAREDGQKAVIEDHLNNNIIFMKLKIALNLKAEEMIDILRLTDFEISKHELSAFFRRATHQHYRECQDQVLRRFLMGMQLHYKGESKGQPKAGDYAPDRQANPYANSLAQAEKQNATTQPTSPKKPYKKPSKNPKAEGINYGELGKVTVAKVKTAHEKNNTRKASAKTVSKASFKWSDTE